MNILNFDKPKKVLSTEKHNKEYSSDSGIDGTYVSNMSKEDKLKWKGKHIKGDIERIEIRTEEPKTNLLVIVYKNPQIESWGDVRYGLHYNDPYQIKMSMNGQSKWTMEQWSILHLAVNEAKEILGIE